MQFAKFLNGVSEISFCFSLLKRESNLIAQLLCADQFVASMSAPPKWATHGLLTVFSTWRVGDLNLIVCLAGMRNLSQKCQVFPAELGVNALNM